MCNISFRDPWGVREWAAATISEYWGAKKKKKKTNLQTAQTWNRAAKIRSDSFNWFRLACCSLCLNCASRCGSKSILCPQGSVPGCRLSAKLTMLESRIARQTQNSRLCNQFLLFLRCFFCCCLFLDTASYIQPHPAYMMPCVYFFLFFISRFKLCFIPDTVYLVINPDRDAGWRRFLTTTAAFCIHDSPFFFFFFLNV